MSSWVGGGIVGGVWLGWRGLLRERGVGWLGADGRWDGKGGIEGEGGAIGWRR